MAVSHRNTPYGRRRTGLCSGFISRLTIGDVVYVSIKPGSIRGTSLSRSAPAASGEGTASAPVPARIVPNILIGPGTGVAPMRALIQHEVARQALTSLLESVSAPTPNTLLFFGCRKRERDNLYAADWAQVNSHRNPFVPEAGFTHVPYVAELQPGAVAVSTAFSQDQLVKVYVTHKIKEQGELVCRMLQQVNFAPKRSTKLTLRIFYNCLLFDVAGRERVRGGLVEADARGRAQGPVRRAGGARRPLLCRERRLFAEASEGKEVHR